MNVEIGTETPIFLFWEYLFRNFLSSQCVKWILRIQIPMTFERNDMCSTLMGKKVFGVLLYSSKWLDELGQQKNMKS